MQRFILTRLLQAIPALLGTSVVIFVLIRLIPGDPARMMLGEGVPDEQVDAYRESMGYNQPIVVQYLKFLQRALTGDLGTSIYTRRPVLDDLLDRLPATLQLAGAALSVAFVFGCIWGTIAAVNRARASGFISSLVSLIGISVPSYWLALMLIVVFAVKWRIFPATGREGWESVVLPAISLGLGIAAIFARMMRSSLLETLSQDYIRTARAKGLAERSVLVRHAMRTALIAPITVLGIEAGGLIGGAVVTETIFAWPGLGQYLMNAVTYRDYPAIQGVVLVAAVGFILMNLLVDILYGLADPRVRLT
ncbi:MAG: ABC transporter permease [Chloroflexota bacterium]|nr:ABC transporter permease [Chloroflexota bacterium]